MKNFFLIFFIMVFSQAANANKKDITNINFKSSVAKGKIGKSYEIVKVVYTSRFARVILAPGPC